MIMILGMSRILSIMSWRMKTPLWTNCSKQIRILLFMINKMMNIMTYSHHLKVDPALRVKTMYLYQSCWKDCLWILTMWDGIKRRLAIIFSSSPNEKYSFRRWNTIRFFDMSLSKRTVSSYHRANQLMGPSETWWSNSINIFMGIKWLPIVKDYWSSNPKIEISTSQI